MKKIPGIGSFLTVVVCCIMTGISCSQFPTELGYIGSQYVQTVGFVFTPLAEGAPGDTLHLHAYFAGEPVRSYACSLSTQYSVTQYGSDTAVNFKPLTDPGAVVSPDSIVLSFVIPQDFFASAGPLIKAILATLPDSLKALYGLDSATVNSVPVSQLPALAGLFLTTTDFSTVDTTLGKQVAHLAELLSGQIVLHLAVNNGYTITRNLTVRYNSHIRNNRFIYVNKNPDPWWIAVYKVRNRTQVSFGPADLDSRDTMFCLYARDTSLLAGPKRFTDTVLVDTGFTYYAAADSGITGGIDHRDSAYTNEGFYLAEDYSYLWFYQPDTTETSDRNPRNSISIGNSRGYYSPITTPSDTAMHNITLWARVSESASGILNAPTSVSVRQVHVVFRYSAKYASSVKIQP
jgi:hypothetical protein